MGATLSREEYGELVCRGTPDKYPKSTEEAVSELRARGYDVRVPTLDYWSGWVEFRLADDMRAYLQQRRGETRRYKRIMMPDEIAWRKQRSKQK